MSVAVTPNKVLSETIATSNERFASFHSNGLGSAHRVRYPNTEVMPADRSGLMLGLQKMPGETVAFLFADRKVNPNHALPNQAETRAQIEKCLRMRKNLGIPTNDESTLRIDSSCVFVGAAREKSLNSTSSVRIEGREGLNVCYRTFIDVKSNRPTVTAHLHGKGSCGWSEVGYLIDRDVNSAQPSLLAKIRSGDVDFIKFTDRIYDNLNGPWQNKN